MEVYDTFFNIKMGQLQEKYKSYRLPQKYMAEGVYPYFREITSKQGTLLARYLTEIRIHAFCHVFLRKTIALVLFL